MTHISQVCWDMVALTCLVGLVVTIVWIHLSSPLLTSSAPLTSSSLSEISVAVAIVATLFTMFITDRIRHGFIRSLEAGLCTIESDGNHDTRMRKVRDLERSWRAILRIDGLRDRFVHASSAWFFLRYLATGFLTASIITTFTPRAATKYVTYNLSIPGTGYPTFSEQAPTVNAPCAYMLGPNGTDQGMAKWPYTNGSAFIGTITGSPCPATDVVALVGGINSDNADDYAYVDSGIAVQRTAMGASRAIFTSTTFSDLLATYGPSLNRTTQCVPVLKSNPIRCERDRGTRLEIADYGLRMVFSDGNTDAGFRYNMRNLTKDNVMANIDWTGCDCEDASSVGRGWMEFSGYTGNPNATTSHANDLALIMGEDDKTIGLAPNSTYFVRCTINPQNSFEYRIVSLLLNYTPRYTTNSNHTGSSRLGYTRSLVGGEPCMPSTESVGLPHYAAVFASQQRLLDENRGTDNYFSTVQRAASRWGRVGPPFAFLDSRNALEDALGVVAALGVSTMAAAEGNSDSIVPEAVVVRGQGDTATTTSTPPTAVIDVSGFSSSPLILALVFIPPVLTYIVLLQLFISSFKVSWQPGGGLKGYDATIPAIHQMQGKESSKRMFVAESLSALIALGGRVLIPPTENSIESAGTSATSSSHSSTIIRHLEVLNNTPGPNMLVSQESITLKRSTTI